jgi:sugar phosphate permease
LAFVPWLALPALGRRDVGEPWPVSAWEGAAAILPLVPAAMLTMFAGLENAALATVALLVVLSVLLIAPRRPSAAVAAYLTVIGFAVVHAQVARSSFDPPLMELWASWGGEPDPYLEPPGPALAFYLATLLTLLAPLGLWANKLAKGRRWPGLVVVGLMSFAAIVLAVLNTDLSVYNV